MNKEVFDAWTLAHLALGFALGKMGVSRRRAMVFALVWEVFEQTWERMPERGVNAVTDVAANALGWELGHG